MVNRSVVIVKAKQSFVNWLAMLPDPASISLEELNREPNAYLLPECENEVEQEMLIRRYYPGIFEAELEGWWENEDDWPKIRDYQAFTQWFQIEFSSAVFDMTNDELCDDEDE
jgi:hypothetical protein